MKTIAIVGATGHIGKGLAVEFSGEFRLALYARRPHAAAAFAETAGIGGPDLTVHSLDEPLPDDVDLIVNAIGPGDPQNIREAGAAIEAITEQFDRWILDHIKTRPRVTYVFLSTGAVFGRDYDDPDRPRYLLETPAHKLDLWDHYPRAKLLAETRHREMADHRIADLRIFGYVSRYIDPDGGLLMSEIAKSMLNGTAFHTDPVNFVRDYIGPEDLASLILYIFEEDKPNGVFAAQSADPTTKLALLKTLEHTFGLEVCMSGEMAGRSVTRMPQCLSFRQIAAPPGYAPKLSSEETVIKEFRAMLHDARTVADAAEQGSQIQTVSRVSS